MGDRNGFFGRVVPLLAAPRPGGADDQMDVLQAGAELQEQDDRESAEALSRRARKKSSPGRGRKSRGVKAGARVTSGSRAAGPRKRTSTSRPRAGSSKRSAAGGSTRGSSSKRTGGRTSKSRASGRSSRSSGRHR